MRVIVCDSLPSITNKMKLFALEAVLLGALVSMVGATDHAGEMKSEMKYDMGTATPPMKKVTDGSGSNGYGKGNAYGNGNAYNPIPMDKPAEKSVEAVSVPVEAKAEMKVEGEKANENIMVISQNWGDNKGEMVVSAASPGGTVHTVRFPDASKVFLFQQSASPCSCCCRSWSAARGLCTRPTPLSPRWGTKSCLCSA